MTEEEIKEIQANNERLQAELEEEKGARETAKADYEKSIAEKDELIRQKTEDVVGTRKKFKKLKDMSEEEKETMTEKELELQERAEALDARQTKQEEESKESRQKEINARKSAAIKKFAGDDEDLVAKIEANFGRITDAGKAQTEDEIGAIARDAYNMLGTPSPSNAMESNIANGGYGDAGDNTNRTDFSETEQGKSLAQSLGLNQSKDN